MDCSRCGTTLPASARFCPGCGAPAAAASESPPAAAAPPIAARDPSAALPSTAAGAGQPLQSIPISRASLWNCAVSSSIGLTAGCYAFLWFAGAIEMERTWYLHLFVGAAIGALFWEPLRRRLSGESASESHPSLGSLWIGTGLIGIALAILGETFTSITLSSPVHGAILVAGFVSAGSLTFAWLEGVRHTPRRAGRFGLWAGIANAVFNGAIAAATDQDLSKSAVIAMFNALVLGFFAKKIGEGFDRAAAQDVKTELIVGAVLISFVPFMFQMLEIWALSRSSARVSIEIPWVLGALCGSAALGWVIGIVVRPPRVAVEKLERAPAVM